MSSEKGVTLIALVIIGAVLIVVSALAICLAVKGTNKSIEPASVYVEQKAVEEIQ